MNPEVAPSIPLVLARVTLLQLSQAPPWVHLNVISLLEAPRWGRLTLGTQFWILEPHSRDIHGFQTFASIMKDSGEAKRQYG